jgi:hypothetical protein
MKKRKVCMKKKERVYEKKERVYEKKESVHEVFIHFVQKHLEKQSCVGRSSIHSFNNIPSCVGRSRSRM